MLRKRRLHEKWGIRRIIVVDPEARIIRRLENGAPAEKEGIATRGEAKISAQALWDEVDLEYKP